MVNRDDFPLRADSLNEGITNKVLTDAFEHLEKVLGNNFRNYGVDVASTHTYFPTIDQSGTPLYFYSGWYDGGFANAAIKKFLNYTNSNNHLILGPWDHGGFFNISPDENTGSVFDHRGELLKFFDAFLKTASTSPYVSQPRVLYYTMAQDKWKKAENWPVKSTPFTYYFSVNNILDTVQADQALQMVYDTYIVDTTATTGVLTRWSSLTKGPLQNPYNNRNEEDKKLLTYTSRPLADNVIITGHPLVQLYLSSSNTDGAIFIYLEDIDENGRCHYVTEGELRLIHRKIVDASSRLYKSPQPYRSYKAKDAAPMITGKIEKLEIPLQPTSYLFRKGHCIRVAISGADRDNFPLIPEKACNEYKIFRDGIYSSRIVLPKTDF